jgi:hypothetical protein
MTKGGFLQSLIILLVQLLISAAAFLIVAFAFSFFINIPTSGFLKPYLPSAAGLTLAGLVFLPLRTFVNKNKTPAGTRISFLNAKLKAAMMRANPFINKARRMSITPPEKQRNIIFPGLLKKRENIP